MPTAVTEGIRVTVESVYLEDRSVPDEDTYAFAYVVAIANEGATRAAGAGAVSALATMMCYLRFGLES